MSRTPILDGEQPLPVRKVFSVAAVLMGVILGVILIALSENVIGAPGSGIPPAGLPLAIAAFYVAVFVHECGHLLAGIMAEFEPRTFMVGMFLLSKEGGTWRFRVRPRYLFSGGLTAVRPLSDQKLLHRFILVVAGGPAASLALLIVAVFLPAGTAMRILYWISLLLLISVFIPYTAACLPSDSKLILLLARRGPVSDRLVATLYLLALDGQGIEPREWPRHWIAKLELDTRDKSRMPQALVFLLADAAEKDDMERAEELLERALAICDKMLPTLRQAFLTAASGHHGFYREDAASVEEWLNRARSIKGSAPQKDWNAKALAAIAFAKGDQIQATEMLDRHIGLLNRQPVSGMVAAERRRMIELRDRLAAQTGPPQSSTPAAQARA